MTPHIEAKENEIAKIVIMPGDPKRASLIAENFLDDYKIVSNVRGMITYTGTYKGKRLTVMPSGMGIPSMGIYSYELFKFYDVDKIIKVGTCGSYTNSLNLGDIILVENSYSESTYAKVQDKENINVVSASKSLNNKIESKAKEIGLNIAKGTIHCSDVFYEEDENYKNKLLNNYGCIACEMESFSLLYNAKKFNKEAAEILTVTDNLTTGERADSNFRQNKVNDMLKLALESSLEL